MREEVNDSKWKQNRHFHSKPYQNKMIGRVAVKILTIFCPIAVQTMPDYYFVVRATVDYHHHRWPSNYGPIVDCNRDFVFLEDYTEYLVCQNMRL